MPEELRTVWWETETVCLIDQRKLPHEQVVVRCTTLEAVANGIKTMQVRGAPAIGCAAAYGMVLEAYLSPAPDLSTFLSELAASKEYLDSQRPTAVNLAWATERILAKAKQLCADPEYQRQAAAAGQFQFAVIGKISQQLLEEAHAIVAEDLAMCHAIGDHGVDLIPAGGRVLTHCNAGGLATAGYGTAIAPIRTAFAQGREIHVFVDETRPYMQGARLTAWELQQAGIPLTLITDNMAGYMMQRGVVDCIIVGADRIVANGDTANKIGTYSLAVLAKAHNLPFYVAAPSSTIDLQMAHGDLIPIEERPAEEVTHLNGQAIAPAGIGVANPAFDVTPHHLISAIITERGVVYPPFGENLQAIMLQEPAKA